MIRTTLLTVLALAPTLSALSILSPPQLACNVAATQYSRLLGSQLVPDSPGRLVHTAFRECSPDLAPLNNTFVLITLVHTVPLHTLESVARCWESLGASAIIVVRKWLHIPGDSTYIWDKKMKFDVNIPVLNAGDSNCIDSVVAELQQNSSAVISVLPTLTSNAWQYFVESTVFLVVFRIGLPAFNAIIVGIALDGFIGHILLLSHGTKAPAASWLALSGCLGIIVSCSVRVVYFVIGPFRMTTRIPFETSDWMFNTVLGTTSFIAFVATALLYYWSTSGKDKRFPFLVEGSLVLSGVQQIIGTQVFVGWQIAHVIVWTLPIELLGWILMVIGTVFTAACFLLAGRAFLKRLAPQKFGKATWRSKALTKAVFWIITAGAAEVIVIVGALIMTVSPTMRLSPIGLFLIYGLVFYGFSLSAIAHALSFRPISANSYSLLRNVQYWLPSLRFVEKPKNAAETESHRAGSAQVIVFLEAPEVQCVI